MENEIKKLKQQNEKLQVQLLESQIDTHFQKNGLNPEMRSAVKVLAREQAVFDDGGNRVFKSKDRDYVSLDLWITSLPETEKIPLEKIEGKSSQEAQKPRCKNDMTWDEKAAFKKEFGYAEYDKLPLNSVVS